MRVHLNNITGIDDAIISMHLSKRSWTPEKDADIRNAVATCTDRNGKFIRYNISEFKDMPDENQKAYTEYTDMLSKVCKWGRKHITLLKFINFSVFVEGIHRGGQDDIDSHAKRFDNRIVRSSTRLASFSDGEKSEYYTGKIKYPFEAAKDLHISFPESYEDDNGVTWHKKDFGYIKDGFEGVQDVKRGLYPLAIPSNFIFACNLADWAHVYKERNNWSAANPEVQSCVEMIAGELYEAQPMFSPNLWMEINT